MQNIKIHRYKNAKTRRYWQGYVVPDDGSWILFIPGPEEGRSTPHLHLPDEAEEVDPSAD